MATKDKNRDEISEETVDFKAPVNSETSPVLDDSVEVVEEVPLDSGLQATGEDASESQRVDPESGDGRLGEPENEFIETVVRISRVAKVVKGGRRFSFSTISVVGDGKGNVGIGLGKANEVPGSIQKSFANARRNMVSTVIVNGTIPYEISAKSGAGKVFLKPASEGTGVIAGGSIRAVVEAAGYRNILSKSLGSNNPVNVLRATVKALGSLQSLKDVSTLRGKTTEEIFN